MLDRLNRALERVEEDPGAPPDAAAMARDALTSEHHLRRLFSALAGMSLSEYARRRRLTLAGAEVLHGDDPLLDVAVRYGYGSAEAFARAFRSMHGVGPGEARRTGAVLASQPRMTFRLTVEGSTTVRYRIVEKEAFRLVGPRARVPLVHRGPNPDIVAFTKGLGRAVLEEVRRLSDQEPRGVLSVSVHLGSSREEGTELDYYQAAATTAPAPSGMEVLEVPAGTWVVFPYSGPSADFPEPLQRLWSDAFGHWFPSHPSYRTVEGPSILRVEYGEDCANAEAELWLPVERAD
ncbi:AraC family transcriptional regulator [Streptomonospora nanhaiensis]|uniref:AraC family transcriptional regulator n=1 Tax=Streptomonospora nanhaiensis TaxID=1323731 RepID=A0ABY6YW02_9ACTN|nr:AraC family transcriptional regulator [Streptomonospora nanhaiensis]WAE76259.1 AraC family transcriptional regulator [Streptomonospora nanhaiensis]